MYVYFRRGTEDILKKKDMILKCSEIICTLPDEYKLTKDGNILSQPIFKFKIGDGIHKWSELPYNAGTIPVKITLCELWAKDSK